MCNEILGIRINPGCESGTRLKMEYFDVKIFYYYEYTELMDFSALSRFTLKESLI